MFYIMKVILYSPKNPLLKFLIAFGDLISPIKHVIASLTLLINLWDPMIISKAMERIK